MIKLCESLQKILDAELAGGNEVVSTDEGAFSKIDYVVYLKRAFKRDYLQDVKDPDVSFYANHDAHYNLGESYSSTRYRQAVEAPFASERK